MSRLRNDNNTKIEHTRKVVDQSFHRINHRGEHEHEHEDDDTSDTTAVVPERAETVYDNSWNHTILKFEPDSHI